MKRRDILTSEELERFRKDRVAVVSPGINAEKDKKELYRLFGSLNIIYKTKDNAVLLIRKSCKDFGLKKTRQLFKKYFPDLRWSDCVGRVIVKPRKFIQSMGF